MSTLELKVYDIFKNKFGEKEAEAVIDYLDTKAEEKYQQKKDVLLTKEDKIELLSKIEATNTKIEAAKSEMIKWFFAFFITIFLMIVGLYIKK